MFLRNRPCCPTWQSHAVSTSLAAGGGRAVRASLRTNPILAVMGARPVHLLLAQSHKLLGVNCYKRPPKAWWPRRERKLTESKKCLPSGPRILRAQSLSSSLLP